MNLTRLLYVVSCIIPASRTLRYSTVFESTRFLRAFNLRSVCDNSDVELMTTMAGISTSSSSSHWLVDAMPSIDLRVKSSAPFRMPFFSLASETTCIHAEFSCSVVLLSSTCRSSSTFRLSNKTQLFMLDTLGSSVLTSSCKACRTNPNKLLINYYHYHWITKK